MSILDFVVCKGANMKLGTRKLDDCEDEILERTKDVCYSHNNSGRSGGEKSVGNFGTGTVSVAPIIGPSATAVDKPLTVEDCGTVDASLGGGDPLNTPSHDVPALKRMKVVSDIPSSSRPPDPSGVPPSKFASPVGKLKGKNKVPISFTASEASSKADSVEDFDSEGDYVPLWQIKNGDTFEDSKVCHEILYHSIPPAEFALNRKVKGLDIANRAGCAVVRAMGAVGDLVDSYTRKYHREKVLKGRLKCYQARISSQAGSIHKLKRKFRKLTSGKSFSKKHRETLKLLEEKQKEFDTLKEKMDEMVLTHKDLTQLNSDHVSRIEGLTLQVSTLQEGVTLAEREKQTWARYKAFDDRLRAGLSRRLRAVCDSRDLIIKEGLKHVVSRLHRSEEFLKPLGKMETALWASALHTGIVVGFDACGKGQPLEAVDGYDVSAGDAYKAVASKWQDTHYPYLDALAGCIDGGRDGDLDMLKAVEPATLAPPTSVAGETAPAASTTLAEGGTSSS